MIHMPVWILSNMFVPLMIHWAREFRADGLFAVGYMHKTIRTEN